MQEAGLNLNKLKDTGRCHLPLELLEEMFETVSQIWICKDMSDSVQQFTNINNPKTDSRTTLLLRDSDNKLVGFFCFRCLCRAGKVGIVRGYYCTLKKYRKNNFIKRAAIEVMKLIATAKMLHPLVPWYIMFTATPLGYCYVAKASWRIYPSPYSDTPKKIQQVMKDVVVMFNLLETKLVAEDRTLVFYPQLLKLREMDFEGDRNVLTAFYQTANPFWKEGYSLLALIDLSWYWIIRQCLFLLWNRIKLSKL